MELIIKIVLGKVLDQDWNVKTPVGNEDDLTQGELEGVAQN